MGANSIFSKLSIDRKDIHWEDHLMDLTPFEFHQGVWFKREDYFAPFGYGGINGSKLRQCIYLIDKYVRTAKNPSGILSGASVKSPQLSMSTAVAKHYGLESIQVIGATKPETAMQYENVAIAAHLGAKFVITNPAYNPVLQKRVQELQKTYPDYFKLEYGISVSGSAQDIEAFHRIGAEQVRNFPDEVEQLVIPTGSANSAISVLYGIALYPPKNLKTIYLVLIGPNKTDFMQERLEQIRQVAGLDDIYGEYEYKGFDLHGTGYASYSDEMKESYDGIDFHPTYEGKVWRYLNAEHPEILMDSTCVWIVGSKPKWENMALASSDPSQGFVLL